MILTFLLPFGAPALYATRMMVRALTILLLLGVGPGVHGQTPPPKYADIFKSSVLTGTIGETPVQLYLAPSPYIRDAAADFISAATGTLDVCMYELNLPMILGRLYDAHQRGVKVRVAVPPSARPSEYDDIIYAQYRDLDRHQVVRYVTPKSGLMHNKFMVADRRRIWTGSYNLTRNDTEMNDNNAITLSNDLLAANYTAEFEEIWDNRHGKRNATPTPHPDIRLGGTTVKSLFSPDDDMEAALVAELNRATNSIYIMAFGLSDQQMFEALSNQVARGVAVYVLFDLELSRQRSSQSGPLRLAGATVRVSSNNGQMHHKVIVVDGHTVITGSPNFSRSAFEQNDENALIFSCPPLARAFMREFDRCWRAKPYIWNKWSQPAPAE